MITLPTSYGLRPIGPVATRMVRGLMITALLGGKCDSATAAYCAGSSPGARAGAHYERYPFGGTSIP